MESYLLNLAFLASVAGIFAYYLQNTSASPPPNLKTSINNDVPEKEPEDESPEERNSLEDSKGAIHHSQAAILFRNNYFAVYALVLAADWLQGPYIYDIYRQTHQLGDNTIATLFGTGFVCAGISSSFLGTLADRYGRRNACLGFCVATTLSCLSVLAPSSKLPVLFLGRACGGLSSTLLYSVFEAWMVTEHNARELAEALPLSNMFTWSSTLSALVAIITGIIGECMVKYTGSQSAPFMLAICCLGMAALGIMRSWNENYGKAAAVAAPGWQDEEKNETPAVNDAPATKLEKIRLMILGLATTTFEGSMYLFVFFWTPTLISSRQTSGAGGSLPLGLIFSSFMCAMMIGSMTFSRLNDNHVSPSQILVDLLAIAACALLAPVLWHQESITFWSFVLFEFAVGVYYPVMGKLKSEWVRDSVRAQVYTWLRLPLNIFVFTALSLTKEGKRKTALFMSNGIDANRNSCNRCFLQGQCIQHSRRILAGDDLHRQDDHQLGQDVCRHWVMVDTAEFSVGISSSCLLSEQRFRQSRPRVLHPSLVQRSAYRSSHYAENLQLLSVPVQQSHGAVELQSSPRGDEDSSCSPADASSTRGLSKNGSRG